MSVRSPDRSRRRRAAAPGRAAGAVVPACALACALASAPGPAHASAHASAYGAPTSADELDAAHECLIEPMVSADVGSQVQGVVRALLVERGQSVARGQPLAELESGVEAAEVEHAEARAALVSEIAARDADLELATLELERVEELHDQDLAPDRLRDEARGRRQVAEAAVVQALENRKLLQIELMRARRLLEQRTIRSPVDGVVVERLAFPGEFVHDNPVVSVARIDPLRVEVVLPARLFGTIVPGEVARVFPELGRGGRGGQGGEDGTLEATVDVVDALIDAGSGTFGVRLRLANPERSIPGGQRCRVAFGAPAAGDADADAGADAGAGMELAGDGSP